MFIISTYVINWNSLSYILKDPVALSSQSASRNADREGDTNTTGFTRWHADTVPAPGGVYRR